MSSAESLETKKPLDTYKDLLHMGNLNNGITSIPRNIYDGAGNALPIRVSSNQCLFDQPTYVSSSTMSSCIFSPASGKSTEISDATLQGVGVSWGTVSQSTFGKQYRKVQQITTKSKDIVLKAEELTDFVLLNIVGDVRSFSIEPQNIIAGTNFAREIHMLVLANGFTVSFAPPVQDAREMFWSDSVSDQDAYPSSINGDFGKTGKDPCFLRFVYFHSVSVGGVGPSPVWISSIIGSALQKPNG